MVELVVQGRHLELVLEVGDGPQALDDRLGPHAMGEIHEQLIEGLHSDVGQVRRGLPGQGHALVQGQQRSLLRRDGHGHHHLVH